MAEEQKGTYNLRDTGQPGLSTVQDVAGTSPVLAGADTTIGTNVPEHNYKQETRGSSWRIERTADRNAVQGVMDAGDEDAARLNEQQDYRDPDYQPTGEEQQEAQPGQRPSETTV